MMAACALLPLVAVGCRTHVPRYAVEPTAAPSQPPAHGLAVAIAPLTLKKGLVTFPAEHAVAHHFDQVRLFAKPGRSGLICWTGTPLACRN